MTKYFTMAISGMTPAQEKQLSEIWATYAWWHGISNFWMLRDPEGTMTAASVRDTIRAIAPTAQMMIVDGQPTTWAGAGMSDSNRNWLKSFWPPEGS